MDRQSRPLPDNRVAAQLPGKSKLVPTSERRMFRGRWIALAVVLMLVGIGAAVWAWTPRSDPQLAELKELRENMTDPSLSDKERQALARETRTKSESLSPAQQEADLRRGRPELEKLMAKRASEFFSLPPDKRDAALDKEIDRIDGARKRARERSKGGAGTPRMVIAPDA